MSYLDDQKKLLQDQLNQNKQSINNSLAMQKQNYDNTINQNKNYLANQIKQMNTQANLNANDITTLQNHRGGFYSGGLNYQLAQNNRNNMNAQSMLRQSINDKNQSILDKYNLLAGQASDQIKQLEMENADKIRALIDQEIQKQAQAQAQAQAATIRSRVSSKKVTKVTSAVPKVVQEQAKAYAKYFTPPTTTVNPSQNLTYGIHGITRQAGY